MKIDEEDGGAVPVNNVAVTPGIELYPATNLKKVIRRKDNEVKKNGRKGKK